MCSVQYLTITTDSMQSCGKLMGLKEWKGTISEGIYVHYNKSTSVKGSLFASYENMAGYKYI